jgi:hypothetical protein
VRWWAFCWVMGWVPLYDPNVLFCTSAYYSFRSKLYVTLIS